MNAERVRIGVIGPNECDESACALGLETGERIARRGGVLVCGGLGGMMAAACEGARGAGGVTVGILPGEESASANRYVDVAIPTGLGAFRNMLVVRACHAVIAIRGAYGTLSEIAFALRLGTPVIGLETWELRREGRVDPGIRVAQCPAQAVQMAFEAAGTGSPNQFSVPIVS